jgi:hypothetical protein
MALVPISFSTALLLNSHPYYDDAIEIMKRARIYTQKKIEFFADCPMQKSQLQSKNPTQERTRKTSKKPNILFINSLTLIAYFDRILFLRDLDDDCV